MDPVYLFSLASQQRSWLSARQALVAQNVANANTPGFQALDLTPFTKTLDAGGLQLASTSALHLSATTNGEAQTTQKPGESWETTHSGNSVSLELEMMKAGDIHTGYSLNASIMKAFQGMWLNSLKG
jgi:flagellar basal-body rod protein FlgB